MNITELEQQWDIDCNIDSAQLDLESIKVAKLHSKYLKILTECRMKMVKLKQDYQIMRQQKFRWVRGELSMQELNDFGWDQWRFNKPLKSETEELLKGDKDLVLLDSKMEYMQNMILALEAIMNAIKSRTWDIKNAIEWKKFQAGA